MKIRFGRIAVSLIVAIMVVLSTYGSSLAGSTTKSLSTNFTLVNLGTSLATVSVDYIKADGSPWTANADYTSFTIPADGGQKILRQYDAASGMSSGQGSVVVSSDQPLGAIVQVLARSPQIPTQGAYNGVSQGSTKYYIPLLQRQNTTGSGVVNSQIIVQNADTAAINVNITLTRITGETFPKAITNLGPGQSYYYDLADEAGLPTGWVGSAVLQSTGKFTAVSNLFLGAHGLMTFNGFPDEAKTSSWFLPLITSRLTNGQSASVAIQNLSTNPLAIGDVELLCTKDAASTGPTTLTVTNTTSIAVGAAYYFNPVVDTVNFPANWYGSCVVSSLSAQPIVAFAQIRYTNGISDSAAYEGIPGNSTNTTLYVPLIIKRLSNGVATAVTLQNLNKIADATVTLTYTPSPEYVTAGGSATPIVIPNVTIPAGGSIIRSHRLISGANSEPTMPVGWYGTLKVTSNQPVQSYVAITSLLASSGDTLMAHIGFTK